jgi:hypothetical protein
MTSLQRAKAETEHRDENESDSSYEADSGGTCCGGDRTVDAVAFRRPGVSEVPAGPVLFIGVAAIVIFGARWWWTPLIGALIALLTTSGWFARLPGEMLRLGHPGQVGKFAAGIFIGTVLQIGALLLTDIAGLAATMQNFRADGTCLSAQQEGLR